MTVVRVTAKLCSVLDLKYLFLSATKVCLRNPNSGETPRRFDIKFRIGDRNITATQQNEHVD